MSTSTINPGTLPVKEPIKDDPPPDPGGNGGGIPTLPGQVLQPGALAALEEKGADSAADA
jgi:hypothetical protein